MGGMRTKSKEGREAFLSRKGVLDWFFDEQEQAMLHTLCPRVSSRLYVLYYNSSHRDSR